MLILVAVTVTIAMDGGIFTKAKKGATDTQFKADKEQLTAAVAGCYNGITGEIDGGSLNDALDGWEVVAGNDNWTCTSVKGNVFTVTETGKITEGIIENDCKCAFLITWVDNSNETCGTDIWCNKELNYENYGEMLGYESEEEFTEANLTYKGNVPSTFSEIELGSNSYYNWAEYLVENEVYYIDFSDANNLIAQYSVQYSDKIENVTIPKNIMGITVSRIEKYSFGYSSTLKSVVIPTTITVIENCNFFNCSELTDIYYEGTEEQWNDIDVWNENDMLETVNIHYNYTK